MSHEISAIDRQEGISQAWHGLTKVKPVLELNNNFLTEWDIVQTPLSMPNGKFSGFKILTTTDLPAHTIGSPFASSYVPVSNKDFLTMIKDATLGIRGLKIESLGSICERGRIFVSASIQELPEFKAAGRVFRPYLNFLSSHDQSSAIVVNTSNICVVCNNTFKANLHKADEKGTINVKIKHTKNVKAQIANVPEIIDGFLGAQAEFASIMNTLETMPIKRQHARELFAGFIGAGDEVSTRKVNQVNRLDELFVSGAGNKGRDLSDVFSAVTDYYTHESSSANDMNRQYVSSEYGAGANAKTRMLGLLQDTDAINKTVLAGRKILASVN